MPETDIGSATYGDFAGTITDYSVSSATTDGTSYEGETVYDNPNWTKWFGYFKKIPELAACINAKARWTIGKGFQSNPITELALSTIKGIGKESFNSIMENMVRTYQINGDSYAEIIRDKKGKLINLKPLDPSTIRIVANKKGLIIRYEQFNKGSEKGKATHKWNPEDIFHLSRDRVADEIHGTSMIEPLEEITLMKNEAMADEKKLMHRNIYPTKVFKLDTDDTGEIAAFKVTADKAFTQGENIYIPKGTVEVDVISTPTNATLNPLPWIERLNQYFFQATGVPQIIVGGAQEITEASAKVAFVAWEATITEEQLFLEEQILSQLNLEVKFEYPASLQNELISGLKKGETMQAATPEDVTAQPMQSGNPRQS